MVLNPDAREFVPLRCNSKHYVFNNHVHIRVRLNPEAKVFVPVGKTTLNLDQTLHYHPEVKPPDICVHHNEHLDDTHPCQTCKTPPYVPVLRNDGVGNPPICQSCDMPSHHSELKSPILPLEDEVESRTPMGNNVFNKFPEPESVFGALKGIRIKNLNNVVFATLNVNSFPGKFDQIEIMVQNNIDVLTIIESKLDNTYPTEQFLIKGFREPYRFDRIIGGGGPGGGVLIYVREDIPSKQLTKHVFPEDIEGLFVEINLRKSKWLVLGSYHPPSQPDQYYFDSIGKYMLEFMIISY